MRGMGVRHDGAKVQLLRVAARGRHLVLLLVLRRRPRRNRRVRVGARVVLWLVVVLLMVLLLLLRMVQQRPKTVRVRGAALARRTPPSSRRTNVSALRLRLCVILSVQTWLAHRVPHRIAHRFVQRRPPFMRLVLLLHVQQRRMRVKRARWHGLHAHVSIIPLPVTVSFAVPLPLPVISSLNRRLQHG